MGSRWGLRALVVLGLAAALPAAASPYRGMVSFGGFPVPGATVVATRGAEKVTLATDASGLYVFPDLADGVWTITVEMQLFRPAAHEVTLSATTAPDRWEMTLLPLEQLMAVSQRTTAVPVVREQATVAAVKKADAAEADTPRPPEENAQRANDGFLVNGSSSNAATSQYSMDKAFGNRRAGVKSLYTGGLAAIFDNSALDARPYSLAGLLSPKASYNRFTGVVTLGGPIRIPRVLPRGPNFFLAYQWTRDRTAAIETGLVPTVAERAGDLSGVGTPILNPATGQPYVGNQVPVTAQARALLGLYPLPNLGGTSRYNYQTTVLDATHQDSLESRLDKSLGRRDQVYGGVNFQNTRASTTNLFHFLDATKTLGLNANVNWSHRFSQHLFLYAGYRFSRLRSEVAPAFAGRQNVAGMAGIAGTDQDPAEWGPPALAFASGISSLSDQESAFNRNRTDAFNGSVAIYRGRHNITAGGDLRKQEFNDFFQADPRGTLTFTGVATGNDLADFLGGTPDAASIAYGNPDKYLRQPVYDLYVNDDFRVIPTLTLNMGLRWEYGAPVTETKGRLVNLDVRPDFTAVAPVLATDPVGGVTGARYPAALVRPDRTGFEPRVAASWRPIPASTVVVRAGYGVYHDTGVYQQGALDLAQQSPLSKTLSVQRAVGCGLTLANPFAGCGTTTANTFAIDPDFRVGFAQTWQLAVQRDLPGALQVTATYLGVKGSHGVQEFLPNTYPLGGVNPCAACPSGFVYRTSNGASTRESGQVQVRRRLRSGFTATALYTYAHSIDDDAVLGGQGHVTAGAQTTMAAGEGNASIAQDWRNLRAERARSTFDQRHLVNLQVQYTSGQGLGGGDLLGGWRGRVLKDWTVATQVVAGTGLPETPVYFATIPGSGFSGTLRPNFYGAPVAVSQGGIHLNAGAYSAPTPGVYGNAGRNSITGPGQFSLNTSLARTFRPGKRFFLDARVDATNLLNHAAFTGWVTTVNSTQFGLAQGANPMRSVQTTVRLRF